MPAVFAYVVTIRAVQGPASHDHAVSVRAYSITDAIQQALVALAAKGVGNEYERSVLNVEPPPDISAEALLAGMRSTGAIS